MNHFSNRIDLNLLKKILAPTFLKHCDCQSLFAEIEETLSLVALINVCSLPLTCGVLIILALQDVNHRGKLC